ncbi:hypothetical protein CLOSTASPAR_00600 [[Clostridium] asparagiforme DSM 15981]|uniref:Uncharacterized protein n=1 Tax=[Clostridium] asparagiforme DSM 15981 TaxID=518636 RepID=C0CUF1_9FIRM|nr:hypothetical protein CLOSTASPAR_00600 [[Clostridium] asparagiforme DSM 15981]
MSGRPFRPGQGCRAGAVVCIAADGGTACGGKRLEVRKYHPGEALRL